MPRPRAARLRPPSRPAAWLVLSAALACGCAATPRQEAESAPPQPPPRLQPTLDVLAARQPAAGLEGGGELAVTRALVEGGLRHTLDPKLQLTWSLGGALDDYDFGGAAFGGAAPWGRIHTLRAGLGVRWLASERWAVFGGPTLRASAEEGASFGDGLQAGLLAGAAWRANERLSIGPGFGLLTQIEASPTVFPILLIRWRLAERLALETGRGIGATQGPGLSLVWKPDERWELLAGGRFDLLRFRLDDRGAAPGGVGEERGLSLFASASRGLWGDARLGLFAGVALGATLRLEDEDGDELAEEDLDPAPFVGFVFQL